MNHASNDGIALSPQQRHLWRLQDGEDPGGFRVQCCLLLEGTLDSARFEAAVQQVGQRHGLLRTTFANGKQLVGEKSSLAPQLVDFAALDADAQEAKLADLVTRTRGKKLRLSAGPLATVQLVKLGPARHVLVLTMPAMCGDALGARVLGHELATLTAGGTLPDAPMQYAELAPWQNELLAEGAPRQRFDLTEAATPPALPFDNLGTETAFSPRVATVRLDPATSKQLEAAAATADVSLAMVLLSAWQTLLRRLTGQDTILTGVTCDGRAFEGLDLAPGLLERALPLRQRIDLAEPFLTLVKRNAVAVGQLLDVQEAFSWETVAGAPPAGWFAVGYGFEDRTTSTNIGGLRVGVLDSYACTQRNTLRLVGVRRPDGIGLELHYDGGQARAAEAEALVRHLSTLVRDVAGRLDAPLAALTLIEPEERHRVVEQFNRVAVPYAATTIHELIAGQVQSHPDAVAVRCGNATLTYAELNARADKVAARLRAHGVGRDVLVGVCLERSVELVIGILATLKAGGAYVPLEPGYPTERLELMLQDAGAPVVLTQVKLADKVAGKGAAVVCVDRESVLPTNVASVPPATPDSRCYVIFTSGSTGRPKGVEVTHRNLVHSTTVRRTVYEAPPQRYLLLSSFAFDSSVAGIFWTLCEGGTLVLPAEGLERDLHEIVRLIADEQITHTLALPSLYGLLLGETKGKGLTTLTNVIVAGEACGRDLVEQHGRVLPAAALWNEYGPTEGTVWSTVHRCRPGEPQKRVPIGKPVPNVRIYVLDDAQQPVPVGMAGELWIGGCGVARGYLGRADLTAERFVADPFVAGGRMYRTGDRARWSADGEVEFLGRADHQVKIRGYRIELEEVEAVLARAPGVREAVVAARERSDAPGDKRLVGYCVPAVGAKLVIDEVRKFLAGRLPEHMVPTAWVELADLPRMPNGKIDRKGLPEPADAKAGVTGSSVAMSPVEEALTRIWADVLQIDSFGVSDNFFQLGGHSLLVAQMLFRVRDAFEVDLPLRAIFDRPTVAGLADLLLGVPERRERVEAAAKRLLAQAPAQA